VCIYISVSFGLKERGAILLFCPEHDIRLYTRLKFLSLVNPSVYFIKDENLSLSVHMTLIFKLKNKVKLLYKKTSMVVEIVCSKMTSKVTA
jgi:hypothetical protein